MNSPKILAREKKATTTSPQSSSIIYRLPVLLLCQNRNDR